MPALSPDRTTVWTALPKQRVFLRDFEDTFEVLYGGAAGGGKSDALLIYSISRRLRYPGTNGLFMRRTFPELANADGAIPRSHELLAGTGATWLGAEKKWKFPGGGVLQFGHMQREEDKYKYRSSAFADICFDEVTSFLESQYLYLFSRTRTTVAGCRTAIRGGTNPGDVGHGWVKARFIDVQPPLAVGWYRRLNDLDVLADESDPFARSRAFVPSRLQDNIHLTQTPEYEANLLALPEDDRRALLEGDWNAWKGSVFKRWNPARHVLEPFAIPSDWRRVTGLDWGVARPFVCEWIAEGSRLDTDLARTLRRAPDPPRLAPCDQNHRYVYREVSQPGLLDEEMAQLVARLSAAERIAAWHADPASFFADRNRSGVIPRDVFARHGVTLLPANNERIMGKRAVDAALGDCTCGVPRLRVFNTCLKLIKNLPDLPYDKTSIEDVDTDANDDEYDCLVAGTLITTDRGDVPIERIKAGDLVLTRQGYRPVVGSWLSHQNAPVLRIEMSDGRAITGTPNHRIPRDDGSYLVLGAVRYGDIMHGVSSTPWTLSSSLRRARISTACATTGVASTSSAKARCCTGKYGPRRMARFLKGTTSTTSTGERKTTASSISCRSLRTITSHIIRLARVLGSVLRERLTPESMQRLPMRDLHESSVAMRQPVAGQTWSHAPNAASSVGVTIRPARLDNSVSVATLASRHGAERREPMTSSASVLVAGNRSASIVMTTPPRAPVVVVGLSDAGSAPVYNLQVDGVHEYFANGILVSNSLRYGLMGPRQTAPQRGTRTAVGLRA